MIYLIVLYHTLAALGVASLLLTAYEKIKG